MEPPRIRVGLAAAKLQRSHNPPPVPCADVEALRVVDAQALRHKFAAASSGARPAGMPARCARPSVAAAAAGGSGSSGSGSAAGAVASRRLFMGAGAAAAGLVAVPMAARAKEERVGEVRHTDEEWLEILGRDRYNILRQAGTEFPLTSELNNEKREGTFVCAGCNAKVFDSSGKYNSGTGWPSFYKAIPGAVDEVPDFSLFMRRTEVRCHRCQGHLGHVFNDGPEPTGLRYCMNGLAMGFQPATA